METLNILPEELEWKIKGYCDELNHSEKFKQMNNLIIKEGYANRYKHTYPFMVVEMLGMTECVRMFDVMRECNCCQRHNSDKPSKEDLVNGLIPTYFIHNGTRSNHTYSCKCPCRHICRNLCREINDIEDDEIIT